MKNRSTTKPTTKTPTLTPPSLKDLIDKIKWAEVKTRHNASKLPDDAVSFHFTLKSPRSRKDDITNANSDFVRVRFGKNILEELEWQKGDKIFVAHDPDDHFTFLLFKVDSPNGFKLGTEESSSSPSQAGYIQFSWRNDFVAVKASNAQLVEYEIHKKHLIFRVNAT